MTSIPKTLKRKDIIHSPSQSNPHKTHPIKKEDLQEKNSAPQIPPFIYYHTHTITTPIIPTHIPTLPNPIPHASHTAPAPELPPIPAPELPPIPVPELPPIPVPVPVPVPEPTGPGVAEAAVAILSKPLEPALADPTPSPDTEANGTVLVPITKSLVPSEMDVPEIVIAALPRKTSVPATDKP